MYRGYRSSVQPAQFHALEPFAARLSLLFLTPVPVQIRSNKSLWSPKISLKRTGRLEFFPICMVPELLVLTKNLKEERI